MKERTAYHLTDVKQTCYRESKFKPEDFRFKCPFGFENVQDMCYNCKWLTTKPITTFQATGKEAEQVAKFVRNFMTKEVLPHQDTKDHEVGEVSVRIKEREKDAEEGLQATS